MDLVFPHGRRPGSLLADDRPHGVTADVQLPADLPQRSPGSM
jgi:hypothetical protein